MKVKPGCGETAHSATFKCHSWTSARECAQEMFEDWERCRDIARRRNSYAVTFVDCYHAPVATVSVWIDEYDRVRRELTMHDGKSVVVNGRVVTR